MARVMIRSLRLFAAVALACVSTPVLAQATYPTQQGGRVAGVVPLVCDAAGGNCSPATGGNSVMAQPVQGSSAAAATDDGANPVKVGGLVNTGAPPSLVTGQRSDAWVSANGAFVISGMTASGVDAQSNSGLLSFPRIAGLNANPLWVAGSVFNGTSWDRQRGDTTGTYVVEVPSASTNAGTTLTATSAVASALVAKASAGNLYGINVVSGASAGFVMVFNATAAPADGAVTPLKCMPLAANTGIDMNFRDQPSYFSTGITVVFSTTGCFTKTASATAFISADVK